MDIAKAGWLFRQSTVLHRWKKYWFVLNRAGELRYFEGPDSHNPEEDKLVLRAVVVEVKAGDRCHFSPPDGMNRSCLLQLKLREDSDLRMCAESVDDMKAWQMALEEAVAINQGATATVLNPGAQVAYPQTVHSYGYGPYGYSTVGPYGYSTGYSGQILSTPGSYVVHNAASGTGQQTVVIGSATPNVVYMDEPRYNRRRCHRYGMWY